MKKIVSSILAVVMLSSASLALPSGYLPYGVGARFSAMGGAGCALSEDLVGAYYNPAGMAKGQKMSVKLGGGAASNGMDKLISTLSSASDPSKFILDNYANALDINGNMNLFLGLNIGKLGISIIPLTSLNLNKSAGTVNGSATAMMMGEGVVTISRGLSAPYLGSINAGANIKYIVAGAGTATVLGASSTTIGTARSGFGFDLGAQAKVDAIPTVPLSVGVVLKDIGATLRGNTNTISKTVDPLTGNVISESETSAPAADYPIPTTFVIGAATKIPVVGLTVALDLDNVSADNTMGTPAYSVTHIGLEYPVAMGLVNLRLGKISGGPAGSSVDMTTYGAGVLGNMINVAMITDNANTKNNQIMFDVGLGF